MSTHSLPDALPAAPAFSLDAALVRQRASASAQRCDEADILAREISRRMEERLDYIRLQPARILDLGCGTGADLAALQTRYPQARLYAADFAAARLQRAAHTYRTPGLFQRLLSGPAKARPGFVNASASKLPFAANSFDLLWSNLLLPSSDDPTAILREMHRCLRVDGLLMFSTLGPDSLQELRAALPAQQGRRVHQFIDMHDLGDALIDAGFADPVMDMEMLTLSYSELDQLFADLRANGANNAASDRPRGLSGRAGWAQARAAYEALRQDGRLPATFEIIQGHAWKAAPKTIADGRSIVHFQPRPARKAD